MLTSLWNASEKTNNKLAGAPTNRLLQLLRRQRLRARLGYSLLTATVYLGAAAGVAHLVELGWPKPLYLAFFILLWNGAKFGVYFAGTLVGAVLMSPFRLARRLRTLNAPRDGRQGHADERAQLEELAERVEQIYP